MFGVEDGMRSTSDLSSCNVALHWDLLNLLETNSIRKDLTIMD